MCGITGFAGGETAKIENDLRKSLQALEHRGPDAGGVFIEQDANIGLGHRRLSIIDTDARAHQPFHSADGRYTLIFNGEIYNFQELAAELAYKPLTKSDTEIIPEAWRKWGPSCVKRFNGMFAFALYDHAEQTLHLARDRFGKKPLFTAEIDGILYFASEIKGLMQYAAVQYMRSELSNTAIASFLHLGFIPEPETVYRHIRKFPAGHTALFNGHTLEYTSYWSPEELYEQPRTGISAAEAHQRFESILEKAVEYRLISDVPYGSLLSGGIDSSLVSAIASKKAPGRLRTFTIGFKENAFDESAHARDIAAFLGTEHHEYILEEKEALEYAFRIPDIYDEPYADSSAIPSLLVAKMAASEVKMVLSGDGGDEMFLGYGSYHWARRMANPFWYTLRKPVSMVLHTQDDHKKRAGDVFGYSKGSLQSHIFSQEQYFFSLPELERLMRKPAEPGPSFSFEQEEAIERQNAFDLRYYLKDDLLVKTDRASMHFGLEMRSPFLDKDLAAFALSLPLNLRMEGDMLKGFLKKTLYTHIPESYFNRPKRGFAIPLKKWLKNELYVMVETYLSKEALESTGVLNPVMVKEILHAWKNGAERLYNRVWAMILLQQFLMKNAG